MIVTVIEIISMQHDHRHFHTNNRSREDVFFFMEHFFCRIFDIGTENSSIRFSVSELCDAVAFNSVVSSLIFFLLPNPFSLFRKLRLFRKRNFYRFVFFFIFDRSISPPPPFFFISASRTFSSFSFVPRFECWR